MESRGMIESAAVSFFTQVMSCHVMNQLLFAKVLCEVIKEQSSSSKSGTCTYHTLYMLITKYFISISQFVLNNLLMKLN